MAGTCASKPEDGFEGTIHRRYFAAGILTLLTAGATWGMWLLWRIGFSGKFTGVSLHEVNAHGHAQIFGWVGLFVMGFGYRVFPRWWQTRLAWARLAGVAFGLMLVGLALGTVGMTAAGQPRALSMAMAGGGMEVLAICCFAVQVVATFALSQAPRDAHVGFVMAGVAFFVIQAGVSIWHTWRTMAAGTQEELLWQVATWQAPLRDVQIHGLALLMILGVSLRMLPAWYDVPRISERRAWVALWTLVAAVVLEVGIFVAYRESGRHWIAAFLMAPWVMLVVGVWMVIARWRVLSHGLRVRRGDPRDRSAKFIRAAYVWLMVSLTMLLLLPAYQAASRIPFSHAYYGAVRHAITVGFVSLMIMGVAAKVAPRLQGVDPRELSRLWGPFVLINIGCAWRVVLQILTDWLPGAYTFVGVSGVLEVTAMAWWGVGLMRVMWRREPEMARVGVALTVLQNA
ncbi:MAG TPA: NnrS family protein [Tepidisphaeraceae bacterium]|jgi:hypothetical protein